MPHLYLPGQPIRAEQDPDIIANLVRKGWTILPEQPDPTATWDGEQWVTPEVPAIVPQPRWAEFGLMVMELPEVKAIFAQAIAAGEAPLAVGLGVALGKAADGQSALFLGIWAKAIAHGLVSPEVNGQVRALATAFDLPAEFIAGLAGGSQTG
jgi:hypothetical protein